MKTSKSPLSYWYGKLLITVFIVISSFRFLEQQPDTAAAERQMETAIALLAEEEYEKAKPLLLEATKQFEKAKDWEPYLRACEKLDDCFYGLESFEEGIDFFKKALKNTEDKKYENQLNACIWLRLGYNYHSNGNISEALQAYETGLLFAEIENDPINLGGYYGSLGDLYWKQGNHEKALDFHEKSLRLAIEGKDQKNVAKLLRFIGDDYRTMLKKEKSLEYFRRSLALDPDVSQTIIQFSKAYQAFGMLDSAMLVLSRVDPLLKHDDEKADAYYQYAWLNYDLKRAQKAIFFIDKAMAFGERGYGEGHPDLARITRLAGQIYLEAGNADQALTYFHQVLSWQSSAEPLQDRKENPAMGQLEPGSYWVLDALSGKGAVFFEKYIQGGDIQYLHLAMSNYEQGLTYGEKMRLGYSYQSSKLELYEYLQPIIEGAIHTALTLAEVTGDAAFKEKAFLLAERSKASVLAEALYHQEVKHLAGIPDALLEEEKKLQGTVTDLETAAYYEPEKFKDSLLNARLALEAWKQKLERQHPRYYGLKYAFNKQTDIAQIRSHLNEGELLMQYFMGKEALYSFALSENQLQAYTLPLSGNSLQEALHDFRRSVGDWKFVSDSTEVAERNFLAAAPKLFDYLLAGPLAEIKASRLIIVPDGHLGLIPFGALLSSNYEGSWKSLDIPYLIKKYPIRYAWSAGYLGRDKKSDTRELAYGFGGFGTEYDKATLDGLNGSGTDASQLIALRDYGPLPFADDEIRVAGRITRGKTWLNQQATKENFMDNAPLCGILHIAAHGILDEENPMRSRLVFNKSDKDKDNQLYAAELYNTPLQAQLAVLSACNSGNGQVQLGEGVMSLARSFAYAGCPSLVTSLWRVSDLSAAELMRPFYKSLKKGSAIDESLRAAQLAYLQNASSEYATPIYWAGFVLIGEEEPLPAQYFGSGFKWIFLLGLLGLLVGGVFFIKRRKGGIA